jgi:hypothetical protein
VGVGLKGGSDLGQERWEGGQLEERRTEIAYSAATKVAEEAGGRDEDGDEYGEDERCDPGGNVDGGYTGRLVSGTSIEGIGTGFVQRT